MKKRAQAAGKLCVIWLSWLIGSEVEGLIEQAPSSLVVLWLIVMLGSVVYRCSDHKFVSVQASIVPSWQANAIGYYMDWCSVGSRLALDLMAVFFSANGSNCVNLNEWQTWMKLSVCFEQFGFLWFLDPWEVSEGWPHHSSILAIAQECWLFDFGMAASSRSNQKLLRVIKINVIWSWIVLSFESRLKRHKEISFKCLAKKDCKWL